jgi:hypothetical protein
MIIKRAVLRREEKQSEHISWKRWPKKPARAKNEDDAAEHENVNLKHNRQ